MKNLIIYINCVLIDINDVKVQINTIINKILFELSVSDFNPTYSVNYHKDGLIISFNDIGNFMEPYEIIINKFEDYGWIDNVIKIELNDLLSDRNEYLIPNSSSAKDRDLLSDQIVPLNNKPFSNYVSFN
ncbi:MAG: hypothetical protein KDC67_17440 [Ignavibacteriae bacterium]|nr:hypothetical protein [Ignavibacteriota bacterium]MCB0747400.1 hypothetical protein [Ignavibacteriota bacterium]MCB9210909.1 hypothetical protein [Ignavibacteriales bacterium]